MNARVVPVYLVGEVVAEVHVQYDGTQYINVFPSTRAEALRSDVNAKGYMSAYIRAEIESGADQVDVGDAVGHPTEVRSVSKSGGEKGVKPERYSLIPKPPLDLLAKVYGFGEKKYAPHNFRKGYEWSKSYDALQRHLAAWWEREENDPESGLSHLGHAAFHVFALIVFSSDKRYSEYDDRYAS